MTIQNVFGSTVPGAVNVSSDSDQINLGFLFETAVDGHIVGVRYYEGNFNYPNNSRVGDLWQVDGTKLAEKTFPVQTSNGWKEVLFDSPVPIAAITPYMISVWMNLGNWSADFGGFTNDVISGDIRVYSATNVPDAGPFQGRFTEAAAVAFPVNGSGAKSSYGVDLMFEASATPPAPSADTADGATLKLILGLL
jgi:hypothetical protein